MGAHSSVWRGELLRNLGDRWESPSLPPVPRVLCLAGVTQAVCCHIASPPGLLGTILVLWGFHLPSPNAVWRFCSTAWLCLLALEVLPTNVICLRPDSRGCESRIKHAPRPAEGIWGQASIFPSLFGVAGAHRGVLVVARRGARWRWGGRESSP